MKKRSIVLGTIVALATLAACSGESDSDSGGASDCPSAVRVYCEHLNDCASLFISAGFGDVDTCATRLALTCNAQIDAPGSNTGPGEFAACANALSGVSCDQLFSNVQPAECNVAGTLDDGSACAFDSQCKSTNCKTPNPGCGTCAPQSAAGGPCNQNDDCESSLICSQSVCAQPVAAGGACTTGEQCAGALVCKGGTCATPSGAGESCSPQQGGCDALQGLICDPTDSTCKKATLAQPGESCGAINGGLVGCAAGGSCEGASASSPGTCVGPAADGAACNASDGPDCLAPADCVNGLCTLPSGSAC